MVWTFKVYAAIFVLLATLFACSTSEWKPVEMSARRGSYIEIPLLPNRELCGLKVSRCMFELHYFTRDALITNLPRDIYVLYIPGGPGEVVDRVKEHPLGFIKSHKVRIVYFDVRGTGYSIIPESNVHDQFLRAEYVVEDIEELRKKIFNECSTGEAPIETGCERKHRPWDVIYAHSWGTVVAQIYAHKYKRNVHKLILSAPISRVQLDRGAARRDMIVKNFLSVVKNHQRIKCPWPPTPEKELFYSRTFCFLKEKDIEFLKTELKSRLEKIEREYGSTTFVTTHYREVIKDKTFSQTYPFPEAFYDALQLLEKYGAGEENGFRFETQVRDIKIDAALFVAYFLMLKEMPPPVDASGNNAFFSCRLRAELLELIGNRTVQGDFCKRLTEWWANLDDHAPRDTSRRAGVVYGIYDGIERGIHRLLEDRGQTDTRGCFSTKVLLEIARDKMLSDKKAVQHVVKKIGAPRMIGDAKICRWDPGEHPQQALTLILSGDADPTTAGGQPEHFYHYGLSKNNRVMIKFPGVGHLMAPQVNADKQPIPESIIENFGGIIENFIVESINVSDFVSDPSVKERLKMLGGKLIHD
jgi:pimeloyl-ACP methyl ester carboxylesterase